MRRLLGLTASLAATTALLGASASPAAAEVSILYDPVQPRTNEQVTFFAAASDPSTVESYAWDADNDGQFDEGGFQFLYWFFPNNGTYTLRVRVTRTGGATEIATVVVTVQNRSPVADFTWTPSAPVAGEWLMFDSTSRDRDGTIAAYAWDLDNDGQFDDGSGAQRRYTFPSPGDFVVRLRVTDDDGAANVVAKTVTVGPPAPIRSDYKNAAQFCKAERGYYGDQFTQRYGGGSNAYGKCVNADAHADS